MLKKQQKSMQKTSQFKTQCKRDISHAFETAKITVFYPTVCKTPDKPLTKRAVVISVRTTPLGPGLSYFMNYLTKLSMIAL